jgi:hypothetical protein
MLQTVLIINFYYSKMWNIYVFFSLFGAAMTTQGNCGVKEHSLTHSNSQKRVLRIKLDIYVYIQQNSSYILAVSVNGGWNKNTRRKPSDIPQSCFVTWRQISNLSAIAWRERVALDADVHFVLDKHA